jgi:hypothetical protein
LFPQRGMSSADRAAKVKNDFSSLVDIMEKRIKELDEKERHWAMLEARMDEHAAKAADKITLDIGSFITI